MTEAIHCFATASVRFAIYPDGFDGPRMIAQISEDALRDHFGARGGPESLVAAYERHADQIDAQALRLQHAAPASAVLLLPAHFDAPQRRVPAAPATTAPAARELAFA